MRKQILTAAVMMACAGASLNAMAEDGKTTISGKAFIDMTSIDQKSNSAKTDASGMGADVKRFYVGVDHSFDDMWSANVTTDFGYDSTAKMTQVFIKKAYLQAKFSDAAILRAGSSDLPWVPYVEDLYGNRFIENTLIDRLKFGTSADWGLHLKGKMDMVSYAVSMVNGGGYKVPSRTKGMDLEGRVSFKPMEGLDVGLGYYNGKLGKDVENTPAKNTANRTDAVVAYGTAMYRVGAEYFSAKNWNEVTSTSTNTASGYSVWGSVSPADKVSVFARLDDAKPSKDMAPSMKDKYYNLGVSYQARKDVDLALVYKHEKVDGGSLSTSNGTIGGTTDGEYSEIGVWSQVKF